MMRSLVNVVRKFIVKQVNSYILEYVVLLVFPMSKPLPSLSGAGNCYSFQVVPDTLAAETVNISTSDERDRYQLSWDLCLSAAFELLCFTSTMSFIMH